MALLPYLMNRAAATTYLSLPYLVVPSLPSLGDLGEFNCFSYSPVLWVRAAEVLQWECKSQAVELVVWVPLVCEQSVVLFRFWFLTPRD